MSHTYTTKMSTITEEEENYVRMSLLLYGISQCAARTFFDNEFAPSCLYKTFKSEIDQLNRLKSDRIINKSQWNLLFPPRSRGKYKIILIKCLSIKKKDAV